MKLKCVLINPWVYDFAAVNLWSRPLGLLKVAQYMSQFDVDLCLVDCMDTPVLSKTEKEAGKFGTGKYQRQIVEAPEILKHIPRSYARYGMDIEEFREKIGTCLPADLVLITSLMSYWYPGVQKTVDIVKSLSPGTPVMLGGIYATLFPKHASQNTGADYVFTGHIGPGIEKTMQSLGYDLKKACEPKPYYRLGLYGSYPFAPVLTSMGCPYRCSYCASSILYDGFSQIPPSEVLAEITALSGIGVRDYAFYDDALLVNPDAHIKVILKEVVRMNAGMRFHCPNGLHVRYIDDELALLMKKSGFTTLRLSLETVDKNRQKKTGGKVTSDMLRAAVRTLKRHGFTKRNLGVYLMYGLPGQDLREVWEGIQFLQALGIRIHLTEFSPLPGTRDWEELKRKGIIHDALDPLLTNNTIFSYLYDDYNPEDLKKMKQAVAAYNSQEQGPLTS